MAVQLTEIRITQHVNMAVARFSRSMNSMNYS